ncbi:hypothetical protein [Nocardia bovistercoris]|uniref:Uncharacterized protein n=1 Tax=Nocardia bovistercoris TaxID=2785916 RepID=A0A931N449_9NOCA|nr:hypothetical protein [Nocardia bovistercoris]MBH0777248.1 hypothetical protein [Nocardia bovistercoris]
MKEAEPGHESIAAEMAEFRTSVSYRYYLTVWELSDLGMWASTLQSAEKRQ